MLESSKLGAGLATIGLAEAGVGIGVVFEDFLRDSIKLGVISIELKIAFAFISGVCLFFILLTVAMYLDKPLNEYPPKKKELIGNVQRRPQDFPLTKVLISQDTINRDRVRKGHHPYNYVEFPGYFFLSLTTDDHDKLRKVVTWNYSLTKIYKFNPADAIVYKRSEPDRIICSSEKLWTEAYRFEARRAARRGSLPTGSSS